MSYIVKSSEKTRKSGAETETKALLYLMNLRKDSEEIYYFIVDFFNDLTGMDAFSDKLWDIQSKGAKGNSPTKADSRMLWDAYTMRRKDRAAERYNGVCIEFDKQCLIHSMKRFAEKFDVKDCRSITYGFEGIKDYLEQIMNAFSEDVERLAKEKD